MPYFARLLGRDPRRCRAPARFHLEALEERAMLSGTTASLAAPDAHVTSTTALQTSFKTAVTGAKVTFTATVENASTDVPVGSGKVDFSVNAPQKIDLGDITVTKQGLASVSTDELTKLGNYHVTARYTPTNPKISASAAPPVTVKVIPLPIHVPTTVTLESGATLAETGQHVPLTATVNDAGTGNQINAGKVEPLKGKVEFFVDSASPTLLGTVTLHKKKDVVSLSTKKLKNLGPYQIQAVFVPSNKYFTSSTSAPVPVTITPQTKNSPTFTSIESPTNVVETGEAVTLNATVQNASSSLPDGTIKLTTMSRHPVALGEANVSNFGQQISFATDKLQKVGVYHVQAKYLPDTNRFAESFSAPVTIVVTPLTAASFRVVPVVRHGKLNKPVSFEVTAITAQRQPFASYTGTVVFTSPTDSWTTFPPGVYTSLHISAPPMQSTGLAIFNPQSYTFTPADHGSHTFTRALTFGKAGAEQLQVTQANDPKVIGKATFAIE
jgi:Bacterial Ig-like domain (group 3)